VEASTLTARLQELPLHVVRLASLTTGAIAAGTDALLAGDLAAAQRVIEDDDAVDSVRHSIEDECLALLAEGLSDLGQIRYVAGTLRVAHELERSADLMVNVAKTAWRLHPHPLSSRAQTLVDRMGRQAVLQLRMAVNAFADRDCSWASALADMDNAMDELQTEMLRLALSDAVERDAAVLGAVQLSLVARHYERIGDHAVTIAAQVRLVVTGERASRRRRLPARAWT
jgi:phosphate transport system protein